MGDAAVYSIPRGGAFEWVSCPHYTGEVVIYAGLSLLTWPHASNVPLMLGWVVSVFWRSDRLWTLDLIGLHEDRQTCDRSIRSCCFHPLPCVCVHNFYCATLRQTTAQVTNLVLAAGATQRWYLSTFPSSYPKHRRALIPGVF